MTEFADPLIYDEHPFVLHEVNEFDGSFENAFNKIQAMQRELTTGVHMSQEDICLLTCAALIGKHPFFMGPPGTGKTTIANTLARTMGGTFGRVQGTPDLTPADITGSEVYHPGTQEFNFLRGPIFNNVVLFDEVNRALPKTQSALMEAEQERHVTVGNITHQLPDPFLVIATGNPMEIAQGVNELPKANIDRYGAGFYRPAYDQDDMRAIRAKRAQAHQPRQVVQPAQVPMIRQAIQAVGIHPNIETAAFDLVVETREHKLTEPELTVLDGMRGADDILDLAQAVALARRRQNVDKSDLALVAPYALSHRVSPRFEALTTHDQDAAKAARMVVRSVVQQVLGKVA